MAKSKHATALFEVMNRQRQAATRAGVATAGSATGSSGPKWWFKSRGDVKTIAPGEPVGPLVSDPTLAAAADAAPEPVFDPTDPANRPAAAAAAMAMVPPLASSIDVPQVNPGAPAPRVQPVAMTVDPDRQQISLRLSYTSALIGGFGLFIALGVAVLIGKGLTRGPQTAIANTSTQVLKQKPPTPGVMNLPRRSEAAAAAAAVGSNDPLVEAKQATPPSTGTRAAQQHAFSDPRPPSTFFTDDPHRQAGLNYAIIQSYPNRETAERAADFLTKNGLPCTVEKGLPSWKLPWADGCVVVGIRGFAKVQNNPSLEAYKKQIMEISAKFTANRSGFSAFAPTMYHWRKSN
jgi:hypothetical protein